MESKTRRKTNYNKKHYIKMKLDSTWQHRECTGVGETGHIKNMKKIQIDWKAKIIWNSNTK